MSAAATRTPHHHEYDTEPPHMGGALTGSVFFHALVIIALSISLPYLTPKVEQIGAPIAVEIVQDTDVKAEQAHNDHIVKERPMHNELDVQRVTPDFDVMKPIAPTPPKAPEQVDTTDVPMPAPIEPDKKKAQVKPPVPQKRPPAPTPKPEEKKPDKSEDDKSQQFQSILKNYLKDETVEDKPQQKTASNQQASFTDGISTLEFQAFQRQLSGCWNLMSGTRYAENMIVDIRLTVGPDRKVQNATVVDQARYNSDPYFRAAADSAVRAVYNPSCSPLDLPPEKYELWKDIVVTFDPRKML
jgi:hypothetical protein